MKKIHILALSTFAALGLLTFSCDGGAGSPKATLKNSNDTLSYASGVKITDELPQYLTHLGVLQDTAIVSMSYNQMIAAETDAQKKATIEKELATKLDSINKANKTNLDQFIKGMSESYMSDDNNSAYMRGIEIGARLKDMVKGMEAQTFGEGSDEKFNKNVFLAGMVNKLRNEKLAVENATDIITAKETAAREAAMAKQNEALKQQYAAQIDSANVYMEENKTKAGVNVLPSGVQYKVLKEGTGAKPTIENQVKVFYRGTLTNGTEFDSNMGKEPITFGLGQVIKGWQDALKEMPVGSKWLIYIPFELGYGYQGSGPIPPCSNLIFEVELLDIVQ